MEIDVVLLRHGETFDTVNQVVSGQNDVQLTETGRIQATNVARHLARLGISCVVSSDLSRAKETASIVARLLGLPAPVIDERFRERNWGKCQGAPRLERSPSYDDAPVGGESRAQMSQRVLAALREVAPRTLIVTHAGPIRAILGHVGLAEETLSPCSFVDLHPDIPRPSSEDLKAIGYVLSGGTFSGRAKYVSNAADLDSVDNESLVFLQQCSKAVAIDAMERGSATINLTRSLTAHLTHGRLSNTAYAIAIAWPNGLPRDGEPVNITFSMPEIRSSRKLLADVEPTVASNADLLGGKAAGLLLLKQLGINVPEFYTISIPELAAWRNGNVFDVAASAWIDRSNLSCDVQWAVRSSADVEDHRDDPMSGTFVTCLNRTVDNLVSAIKEVEASTRGAEIQRRLEQGRLTTEPKAAIIVQQMVQNPIMSGTIFLPAPREPETILLEAVCSASANALMDGTVQPQVIARFDVDGHSVGFECDETPGRSQSTLERLSKLAVQEGIWIYHKTGRGDLEFAIDSSEAIWWLQARVVNEPVELVDRRGFHPAAIAYYKELAFRVCEANQTKATYFRCFDLSPGLFGYTVGIRSRDAEFHNLVKQDVSHLGRVTDFGWHIERQMADCVNSLDCLNPQTVLELLTLHGSVQLPFSIPIHAYRMDRFQSEPTVIAATDTFLEEFLEEIVKKLGLNITVDDLLSLLRLPLRTQAAVESLTATLELLRTPNYPDQLLLASLIPDLRDVPDCSPDALSIIRQEIEIALRHRRINDPDGRLLEAEIHGMTKRLSTLHDQKGAFLDDAREQLDDCDWLCLEQWTRYLEMKAETNETHCLYRGRCFVWFGQIGFNP